MLRRNSQSGSTMDFSPVITNSNSLSFLSAAKNPHEARIGTNTSKLSHWAAAQGEKFEGFRKDQESGDSSLHSKNDKGWGKTA